MEQKEEKEGVESSFYAFTSIYIYIFRAERGLVAGRPQTEYTAATMDRTRLGVYVE